MDVLDVVSGRVADNAAALVEERRQRNAAAAKRGAGSELDEHLAALEGLMSELKKDARLNARLKDKQQKARVKSAMTPEDTPGRVKYARKNLGKKYKGVKDLKRILELLKDAKVETGPVQTERRHPAARRRYEAIEAGLMDISEKHQAELARRSNKRAETQSKTQSKTNSRAESYFHKQNNIVVGMLLARQQGDMDLALKLLDNLADSMGIYRTKKNVPNSTYTGGDLAKLYKDAMGAQNDGHIIVVAFNTYVKLKSRLYMLEAVDKERAARELNADPKEGGLQLPVTWKEEWKKLQTQTNKRKAIQELMGEIELAENIETMEFGRHRRSRRHRK